MCTVILFGGAVSAQADNQGKLVGIYVYHHFPPYIINLQNQEGLYFDFADYLNNKSDQFRFATQYMPRKRLERKLTKNELGGIVLGVNPLWFKDKNEQKYLWTQAVFRDRDEIVSPKTDPVEYTDPASLKGKRIGGILGFYYYGIDELAAEGHLTRVNTNGEQALLSMILRGRVDAGIVSHAAMKYLIPRNQWQGKLHISTQPHDEFERRVLLPKQQKAVYEFMIPIIGKLQEDPAWLNLLKSYQ